jgi:alpha-glutamyl/putrescinyl thymine pyrophosphorylase clade 1
MPVISSSETPGKFGSLRVSPVYDTYWKFAAERQNVFFRRLYEPEPPWTNDEVVRTYKFTNVYRASDRVSQYLIQNVIYRDDVSRDPVDIVFRTLLFKLFNKIETWELIEAALGFPTYSTFSTDRCDEVLSRAREEGKAIYSAAYIMPSGRSAGYTRKHRHHLALLARMMSDKLPSLLLRAKSLQQVFSLLLAYPSIGHFLAFQYAIDLNYGPVVDFSEDDFVVAGPGATDGIRKCFVDTGRLSDADIIRLMVDRQESEFERLGLQFKTLGGRRLHLIDCQNLFCEVGKYARVIHPDITGVAGRVRIKQRFIPNERRIMYRYPPKWNIKL